MEGIIEETDYGSDIMMTVLFPAEKAQGFSDALFDRTQGSVRAEEIGREIRAVKVR